VAIYVRSTRGAEHWRDGEALRRWRAAYWRQVGALAAVAIVISLLTVIVLASYHRNPASAPSPLYPAQIDQCPLAGAAPEKVKTVPVKER
jgi:hypothetical protein